jgi:FMN-dependent NADH-azoreductase
MRLFRLDSSIRVEGSVTRALADAVEHEWRAGHPGAEFVHRDLGADPLPPLWPDAMASRMTPEEDRTDAQRAAVALAADLVDELLGSDAFIFAVPMYNLGVPQQVKHWFDMVITDPRAADYNVELLAGRPAVLVLARGGAYAPGSPKAGWDHLTPYMDRMLAGLWGLDLSVVETELTGLTEAEVDPATAHLRDLAERQFAEARVTATRHATRIARGLEPTA